ncbi:hypothetical protein ES703_108182 [subsurface metagenome]
MRGKLKMKKMIGSDIMSLDFKNWSNRLNFFIYPFFYCLLILRYNFKLLTNIYKIY